MQETEEGLVAGVEYKTDLFEAATITRMLQHFESLLQGIVAQPTQRLSELPLLSEAERRQLLVDWSPPVAETAARPMPCTNGLKRRWNATPRRPR